MRHRVKNQQSFLNVLWPQVRALLCCYVMFRPYVVSVTELRVKLFGHTSNIIKRKYKLIGVITALICSSLRIHGIMMYCKFVCCRI